MLENVHVDALGNLGTTVHPPDDVLAFVEKFICELYQPGTGGHSHVKELRWYMFGKNQWKSDRFPPTQETILLANYQMRVWSNDKVCCPSWPQPYGFGWENLGRKMDPRYD